MRWMIFALLAVSFGLPLLGQDAVSSLHVKQLMNAQEFDDAGLHKLTSQELARLDAWLTRYTLRVNRVVNSASSQTRASDTSAIESQINGEFHGWDGETIFKLTNAQIWQQAEYDYTYEYAYMPDVTIYKTAGCWKMKVEDVEDTICVKRIK